MQVMRGIANGAATYAFSVGMQAVCATCMSTLESLSDTLNELNAKSRDACTATNDMLSNSKLGKETMNQVRENSPSNPRQFSVVSLVTRARPIPSPATKPMQ